MEEGPLPPHERAWRHPSELGPPPHEPTSRTGRVLIVSTATLGLLLVGILAVTMTPRRSVSPVAANSTAVGLRARPPAADEQLPLVTPIGGDGWAITTVDALADVRGPTARVLLATGGITVVKIVRTVDDVTLVSLPSGTDAVSFDVAPTDPSGDDTVVLHDEDDPISVPMGELANVEVAEATPVLDEHGRLVGLATGKPDARWMVPIDTVPAAPRSTTPRSTTATSTTATSTTPMSTTPVSATTTVAVTSSTAPPRTTTTTALVVIASSGHPTTTVVAPTTVEPSTAPSSEPTSVVPTTFETAETPETPETAETVTPTTVPTSGPAPPLPSSSIGSPSGGTGGGDGAR